MFKSILRVSISLSMRLYTGVDYFLTLPLGELIETMDEVIDLCRNRKKSN